MPTTQLPIKNFLTKGDSKGIPRTRNNAVNDIHNVTITTLSINNCVGGTLYRNLKRIPKIT